MIKKTSQCKPAAWIWKTYSLQSGLVFVLVFIFIFRFDELDNV
jgi:hypothetical protein